MTQELGGAVDKVAPVTEISAAEVIQEALTVIDQGLLEVQHREVVSADKMADLLLDLRLLLLTAREPVPAVPGV
ncbi:MAG: hypothetical protein JWM05_3244 [Acidimicrobiales bacterium]|nr:hypothetical protein [Acidimicrobiales bacterium]